jgi:hypothetical protein
MAHSQRGTAGAVSYHVINGIAARLAADAGVARFAEAMRSELQAASPHGPTGDYARGWQIRRGRVPAVRIIENATDYGRYVEYGTKHMRAQPVLGQAIARRRR